MTQGPFQPEHFAREDEGPDKAFYDWPRLVAHIDDGARAALAQCLAETLPPTGAVLDLMASFHSHFPEAGGRTTFGLGLNAEEMAQNVQLAGGVVADVNAGPALPFRDGVFDAAVLSVSIQYATRPIDLFRETARVLKPAAPFVVAYADRMFPTKAIRLWRAISMDDRACLIAIYFREAGGFTEPLVRDLSSGAGDELRAVIARRL
ncbi:MAG: class I SAM-dependent methyltransferase [Alphaproteobacteria bacterium]|nr:class I SAM-dependent methyltransferase [Alphaproteobacteria bacterium]